MGAEVCSVRVSMLAGLCSLLLLLLSLFSMFPHVVFVVAGIRISIEGRTIGGF